MFGWPNTPRYTILSLVLWISFLAAVFGYSYGLQAGWPSQGLIALALIPAATVAAQFFLALRQFDGQDEFVRALTAKRLIAASGLTIVIVTAWGSLQTVLGLPVAPLWLIYPLFWGAFGVISPMIKGTRA